jgi:hypothetical protein
VETRVTANLNTFFQKTNVDTSSHLENSPFAHVTRETYPEDCYPITGNPEVVSGRPMIQGTIYKGRHLERFEDVILRVEVPQS